MKVRGLFPLACAAFGIAFLLSGCGSNASSSGSIGLSGTFSDITNLSLRSLSDHFRDSFRSVAGSQLLSFDGYTVDCTTLTSPPTVYSASVNSDGTFSLSLPASTPVRCTLNSSSSVVATMVFTTSQTSMSGDTNNVDSVSLSGSAEVGTIDVDTAAGSAKVQAASLGLNLGSAEPWDMTGTWAISSLGTSLPTGYSDICPAGGTDPNCHGPSSGETVYMRRVAGLDFTPDSTCEANLSTAKTNNTPVSACSGTTGTTARYALEVWASQKTKDACGDRLGSKFVDAKAFARTDFTSSGLTEGPPKWTTSYTDKSSNVHTITEGWKSSLAQTSYEIANCSPVTKGGKAAYKCVDTTNGTYQISIGGGCVYQSNNQAAQIKDWSQVRYDLAPKSCDSTNLTGDLKGMRKDVCYPKYESKQLVCTHTSGIFKTADNSPGGTYDWNSSKIASSGTACSTLNAYPLAQAQCYAQFYHEKLNFHSDSGMAAYCFREIQTDWNATDVSKFILERGPARAQGKHMFAMINYLPGNVATARGENEYYRGVPVSDGTNNSWANCRVKEFFTLTPMKVSDTQMLVVFVSESRNITQTNVCLGANIDSTFRSIFTMTRQ